MIFPLPTLEEPACIGALHRDGRWRTARAENQNQLQRIVQQFQDAEYSVYRNVNPVKPEFNGDRPAATDIRRRRYILIDCDPVREHPDGGKVAATENEKLQAEMLCDRAEEFLSTNGFPEPTRIDSGNGRYLLYACDLPTDSETNRKVEAVTAILRQECPSETAKFDSVSDLPRVIRIPGTRNFKSSPAADRPHRQCVVLSESSKEVSIEQIDALIEKYPIDGVRTTETHDEEPAHRKNEYVKNWIAEFASIKETKVGTNNQLVNILSRCPLRGSDDASAAIVVYPDGGIGFHCHEANHCSNKTIHDVEKKWGMSFAEYMGDVPAPSTGLWRDIDDPIRIAQQIKCDLNEDGVPGIVVADDEIYIRQASRWSKPTDRQLRTLATRTCQQMFDDEARRLEEKGERKPTKKVTRALVTNVLNALDSLTPELASRDQQFIGPSDRNARDIVRLRDCDIDVRAYVEGREFKYPHSPQLFTQSVIDCEWPESPGDATPEWDRFLSSLKLSDEELRYLQQVIGYASFPIELLEKFVMHIGPSRCGKKLIFEVVTMLCGGFDSVVSVDFRDFGTEFGLQEVPGKKLVLVPEATMLDRGIDKAIQRIKAITGGDPVPINRKNKSPLTIKPECVIWMSSNERLALADRSAAINARQLLIQFRETFVGREDIDLSRKLREEVAGILVYALEGLKDLYANNWRFTVPDSWREAAEDLAREAVPLRDFLDECFVACPEASTRMSQVKAVHDAWSDKPVTETSLRRDLEAMNLKTSRLKDANGKRYYVLRGYEQIDNTYTLAV